MHCLRVLVNFQHTLLKMPTIPAIGDKGKVCERGLVNLTEAGARNL